MSIGLVDHIDVFAISDMFYQKSEKATSLSIHTWKACLKDCAKMKRIPQSQNLLESN